MLVQEVRNGASLKIIAGVLGTLLCADLVTRIPFDYAKPDHVASPASSVAGPESPLSASEGAPPVTRESAAAPKGDAAAQGDARATTPAIESPPASAVALPQQPNSTPDPVQQAAASSENAVSGGVPCEQQTWPYIDARCKDASTEAPAPGSRQVRVIGKDSNAPTTVVTPLPNDAVAKPAQQVAVTQPALSAAPQQSPAHEQQVSVPEKPAETSTATVESAPVVLPRPAPSALRQAGTYSLASTPAAEDSFVPREQQPRRLKKPKIVREQPGREQTISTRRTNARVRTAEEAPRARDEESRRGVVQSRAYELPSGRRIVVFRQSNGDVGIAPASADASSFFFGR